MIYCKFIKLSIVYTKNVIIFERAIKYIKES